MLFVVLSVVAAIVQSKPIFLAGVVALAISVILLSLTPVLPPSTLQKTINNISLILFIIMIAAILVTGLGSIIPMALGYTLVANSMYQIAYFIAPFAIFAAGSAMLSVDRTNSD
ncbi:MAG: hypothetical protein UX47_C0006G0103 [Candidatus Collierbacteria bacterium GW2011_GWA2_46_26]|uniref:Uncharacterized protein n=1 Tax=Candidatus Collierbacteria bacterium GW2011_GWA2_46_26 TaxID=1618381 RepID=A0A0G1PKD2_9BACT|nr:MAG: hypothetical protein UW29_C0005G0034 [Candidatus Collierbacteria bacterium GW2011_GWC2_44_13]KKU33132.1 MAG: hypothetical protein UX47_C0006G0103 [Candidatus Collierbacteria bacterium GW2011_GWA2_46_26]